MRDGEFTFYTLQHRRTHETPWLKPTGPLKRVEDREWDFSSFDSFGYVAEPWHGTGNDRKPKNKEAHDELHSVWSHTGYHGWWTLKYAVAALRRVRKGSDQGKFDSRDSYQHHCQAVRYEFRLVKVTVLKRTEAVSCDDLMDALSNEMVEAA